MEHVRMYVPCRYLELPLLSARTVRRRRRHCKVGMPSGAYVCVYTHVRATPHAVGAPRTMRATAPTWLSAAVEKPDELMRCTACLSMSTRMPSLNTIRSTTCSSTRNCCARRRDGNRRRDRRKVDGEPWLPLGARVDEAGFVEEVPKLEMVELGEGEGGDLGEG